MGKQIPMFAPKRTPLVQPIPASRARNTDPETSHDAASSVRDIRASHQIILNILNRASTPLTDEDIYQHILKGRMSTSGARTRRRELVDLALVEDSGIRKTLPSGRKSICWKNAGER